MASLGNRKLSPSQCGAKCAAILPGPRSQNDSLSGGWSSGGRILLAVPVGCADQRLSCGMCWRVDKGARKGAEAA